ncbi:MAG: hypothetical protein ACE5HP_09900 [Gemmatimonadota bacterium]
MSGSGELDVQAGDGERGTAARDEAVDPVLRAKYIDFCSAHLTEVFLSLTDERIFELVEEAAEDARLNVGSLGFSSMVRLVTHKLRESVPLPDFATWSRDYEANPKRYDPYLLGLWKDLLANPAAGTG